MSLFDRFDRIRIVNLPERSDRRREMDRELARIGLSDDPRVAYFPAIRPQDQGRFTSIGAHGVYLSQRQILREAAAAGESLLILEDDCEFTAGARAHDGGGAWDIFYGGWYTEDSSDLQSADIVGAHMMGFSAQGANRVSAYLEALEPDCEIHPPIDAAYVWFRRAHPEVRTEFAVPPLAFQRPSKSDIAPAKWHHRLPLARRAGRLLRKGLRRLGLN